RGLPASVLLRGGEAPAHYDLGGDIARRNLGADVVTTGYVESEDDLTSLIPASDAPPNPPWPPARELSGPWLRSLAAGRCSIVSALAHLAGIPVVDARTWTTGDGPPISVALD